jgi:hypothetical protein
MYADGGQGGVQVQGAALLGLGNAIEGEVIRFGKQGVNQDIYRGVWRQMNRGLYRHSGQYSTCGLVSQDRRLPVLLAATTVAKSPKCASDMRQPDPPTCIIGHMLTHAMLGDVRRDGRHLGDLVALLRRVRHDLVNLLRGQGRTMAPRVAGLTAPEFGFAVQVSAAVWVGHSAGRTREFWTNCRNTG